MIVRILILMVLACGVAACASAPIAPEPTGATVQGRRIEGVKLTPGVIDIAKKEGKVELTKDDRVKCEKYMTTGSHRVKYRCVTLQEEVASREDNTRDMRKIQTPPPSAGARTVIGQ